jgi:hypothetical protein
MPAVVKNRTRVVNDVVLRERIRRAPQMFLFDVRYDYSQRRLNI